MAESLTVLIVGGGGREDAISHAYEKSSHVDRIIVAPGNDFIAYERQKEVITDGNCSLKDPKSILKIARKYEPDLVDVAQDDALAMGTVDLLMKEFDVFGPTKKESRIEWDKEESRKFMKRHKIPAPHFRSFNSDIEGKNYVRKLYQENPTREIYVKATGLTGGKGALKAKNLDEGLKNVEKMKNFGNAGEVFLIEEGLVGEEFSCYAISDGKNYHVFKSAQDNKRAFNFDDGEQTGGMGAISPAMVMEPITEEIEEELISRAINGMRKEGNPYTGILYLGGVNVNGKPVNIEYNARWGDPECQVVLPPVKTDYLEIVYAAINENMESVKIEQDNKTRICVVGASRGYPGDYSQVKGKRIHGLEKAMMMDGVTVYGAGISIKDGKFYAKGGRLFNVVAEGDTILEAKHRAYSAMAHVNIEGNNLHYRTDIGWRDVERFLKTN